MHNPSSILQNSIIYGRYRGPPTLRTISDCAAWLFFPVEMLKCQFSRYCHQLVITNGAQTEWRQVSKPKQWVHGNSMQKVNRAMCARERSSRPPTVQSAVDKHFRWQITSAELFSSLCFWLIWPSFRALRVNRANLNLLNCSHIITDAIRIDTEIKLLWVGARQNCTQGISAFESSAHRMKS